MRCIECEEIELARVRDEPPSQTLPVPFAALDGFPAGRTPRELTRRRLLQWGVAGMASVYAAKELGWDQVWESVARAHERADEQRCLVLLYLAGGNDGLNVLVPNGALEPNGDYTSYVAARPQLHRGFGTTPAGGRVGSKPLAPGHELAFANVVVSRDAGGDNTDVRGFDTLYADGSLAIVPAADAKQYSLSHFDNSDIWFSASYDQTVKTGWLGRWIDRNGEPDNPLQAVSIDTALSKAIRTKDNPVCAISALPMAGFVMNSSNYGGVNAFNVNAPVGGLAGIAADPANAYLARSRATYGLTYATWQRLQPPSATPTPTVSPTPTPTPIVYPTGTLSNRLKIAATLLSANLGTRIITIHWGGFDTHTGQLASHDRQLIELSRALGAFQADLKQLGIEHRVATLVFSEFGRRVKENGTGAEAGTDHGAGGLLMAMGSGVRGGLAGEWPGCELHERVPQTENQGNLKVPTDYRSVYLAVLEEWLGDEDPAGLIGGGAIDPLVRGDGLPGRRLFT